MAKSQVFDPISADRQMVEIVVFEETFDLLTGKPVTVRRTYPGLLALPNRGEFHD